MRRSILLWALPLALLFAGCHVIGPEHFVVFFSPWSSDLDAQGKQVVATVGERARQRPGARITVNGYASPVGTADENQKLSERRTQAVIDALGAAGVPAGRILSQSHGEVDYKLDPIESRRVEITLGEN
jgi:outer membrane protein OmpA-like peptidoglycan-associated protein